jgi:hypothetical protein
MLNFEAMSKFWSTASRVIRFIVEALHSFLNENGFYNYKPTWTDTKVLVKVKDKRIREVIPDELRDFCWNYISQEHQFTDPEERTQVKDEFYRSGTLFSAHNLNLLNEIKVSEVRDTIDKSYLFFQNCYLEVTAEKIIKKEYSSLQDYIWEGDIAKYDFVSAIPESITPSGEFYEFIKDVTKHPIKEVEIHNLESLITITGYLLHRYKNPAFAMGIILLDGNLNGNANGRTGKGLYTKALGKLRSASYQDGKFFQSSDKFAYSNIKIGTRIIVFDDAKKDFDFERLFPLIAENLVIERKRENKFIIPFEDSPKALITSNYPIAGTGHSHQGRKVEFPFSDTYNSNFSPENKFGHLLFNDWNQEEWDNFLMLMAYCLQMYLLEGLIKPKFNAAERALKMNASKEFIEYAAENYDLGKKFDKASELEDFLFSFYGHPKIEQNTFTRWLKLYADAYGYQMTESHSGSVNYFELSDLNTEDHEE